MSSAIRSLHALIPKVAARNCNVLILPRQPRNYAQARYWIYIYVDSQGQLQGLQGGWVTGKVRGGLMAKIPGTIGAVNGLVSQALALANIGGPYRFMYYLPGTNAFTGSTWDDVSVVAVR